MLRNGRNGLALNRGWSSSKPSRVTRRQVIWSLLVGALIVLAGVQHSSMRGSAAIAQESTLVGLGPATSANVEGELSSVHLPFIRSAAPTSNRGRIAYLQSGSDLLDDVYVINPDGTRKTRLTNSVWSEEVESRPQWSPDGSGLLFMTYRNPELSTVYWTDVDGGEPLALSGPEDYARDPVLSPDGTRVAYVSWTEKGANIFVMDVDGKNREQLTSDGLYDFSLTWSPDGAWLGFIGSYMGPQDVYILPADGGAVQNLTYKGWTMCQGLRWLPDSQSLLFRSSGSRTECFNLTPYTYEVEIDTGFMSVLERDGVWSPDRSKIAYADMDGSLHVMNADGTNDMRFAEPEGVHSPVWSPNGEYLAVDSFDHQIYVVAVSGDTVIPLTAGLEPAASPAWSPNGRTIAFLSRFDGNSDVYLVDASGLTPRQVTNFSGQDQVVRTAPVWSPDAKQLVFICNQGRLDEICVVDLENGSITRLTDNRLTDNRTPDNFPAWSPDSNRIAFVGSHNQDSVIHIIDSDGGNLVVLEKAVTNHRPYWSPDGTEIVYAGETESGPAIYAIHPGGDHRRKLADLEGEICEGPIWSPRGDMIAFLGTRKHGGCWHADVYLMKSSGQGLRNVTDTESARENLSWSPDGVHLAFPCDMNGVLYGGLCVLDSSDASLNSLEALVRFDQGYSWSPDGESLAYIGITDDGGGIWIMERDGSNRRRIIETPDFVSYPVWSPR